MRGRGLLSFSIALLLASRQALSSLCGIMVRKRPNLLAFSTRVSQGHQKP